MRGTDNQQDSLFSYSQVSDFVPSDHPLRRIRDLVDEALESMRGTFTVSYSHTGRPSIAPERIIRALLLQILYSVRSERRMIEEIRYNMFGRRGGKRRLTAAADKLYDQDRFITGTRAARVTPHVAQNTRRRRSCIDSRTTRHTGYAKSINACHRVETPFGWGKFNRPLRKTMLRGLGRVGAQAKLVFAGYNLEAA